MPSGPTCSSAMPRSRSASGEIRRALDDDAHKPRYIETAHRRGYRFIAAVTLTASPATVPPIGRTAPPDPTPPATHYARSGDVNIAYQVIGAGPIDLVFVMGWVSHLDCFWTEPTFARFLRRLSEFSRVILFDKRGTGLSDRVGALPTLEQRMDDVRAVMAAAGSREAVLLGVSEGGPMCSLFATTYPERTRALVMIGTYAKRHWAPDYPWAPDAEASASVSVGDRRATGVARWASTRARRVAPPIRRSGNWWSNYLRQGASPGAAVTLTRMNAAIDVRDVLPHVRVPTLVLHRTGDRTPPRRGRPLRREPDSGSAVRRAARRRSPAVCRRPGRDHRSDCGLRHVGRPDPATGSCPGHRAVRPGRRPRQRPAGQSGGFETHVQQEIDWFRGRGLTFTGTVSSPRSTARRAPSPAPAAWPPHLRASAGPDPSACTPASAMSRRGSLTAPRSTAPAPSVTSPPRVKCWSRVR